MSAQVYSAVRITFTGLRHRWPVTWLAPKLLRIWSLLYQRLERSLAGKPGLRGWLWLMFHNREWQKSSAYSVLMWVLATCMVYKLVERLGYGWLVNICVGLTLDLVTYLVHKLWVFGKRNVDYVRSGSRNIAIWAVFFTINGFLAWLVMDQAQVGTLTARGLLGCYGLAMNPVMFVIRDKGIFSHQPLKELMLAAKRTALKTFKM